mmetsp:Transcript_34118/g.78687  ORF Transcript_34118/g.78687 Transcript_34118/m.78687 type:complete len:80 (+) Transcript_34118:47-286(+)
MLLILKGRSKPVEPFLQAMAIDGTTRLNVPVIAEFLELQSPSKVRSLYGVWKVLFVGKHKHCYISHGIIHQCVVEFFFG